MNSRKLPKDKSNRSFTLTLSVLFCSFLISTSALVGQTIEFSGDFNGDGKYDIGSYLAEEGNFIIRYGNGQGSFSRQTVFSWGPFGYGSPFTGDFNGDRIWDIGFYNPNGNGAWFIWYGDSKGNFSGQTAYTWGVFKNSHPFTGDFDGDGKWDIGLYDPNGNGDWFIRYGDGDGQFQRQTAFKWGVFENTNPFTGDFNGDKKWDIGLYNPNGNGDWFIWYGNGTGVFFNQTAYNWGPFATTNTYTGDFDGDGKCDIGLYNPNLDNNWFIRYGNGTGAFERQTMWSGGNPATDWNPCCSNNEFLFSKSAGSFFRNSSSTDDLRKAMCIPESSPKSAPQYTGDALSAYVYISNQSYPGSNGDIRSMYNAVNIDWSSVIWPEYNKIYCKYPQNIFDSVKHELQHEVQAISNINTLFGSLSTYYINPLFIEKGNVTASVVTNVNLPPTTSATISTGDIIENTIESLVTSVFQKQLGNVSPYAPMMLSALLNLSREPNGGKITDKLAVEIANLESDLAATFTDVLNQVGTLKSLIISDYSIYIKLGLESGGITEGQLDSMVTSSSVVYERQLYKDLIPLACNIVFYDPNDTHLGGGGAVYGPPATDYSQPSNAANNMGYKHDAGFFWNHASYYSTNRQLLTSYVIFNAGDAVTGSLDANAELSQPMYTAIFDQLGFTYDELLALPGMVTYYQCSLCASKNGCNQGCRSSNSRGD